MEKLLVTSNFSFSRNVFKRLVLQTRKNQGFFGKGLNIVLLVGLFLLSAESDILPEVCHAYSARNIENGLTARVLKDG